MANTANPTCAKYRRKVIRPIRAEFQRQINAVNPRVPVVVVGLVQLFDMFDDNSNCFDELVACTECSPVHRKVHRIWLDITPAGQRGKDAQVNEAVKRSVVRELREPASKWEYDPRSVDPWEHVKPPARRITKEEQAAMFRETYSQFAKRGKKYARYLQKMRQSFRQDQIFGNHKRAEQHGFKSMNFDKALEYVTRVVRGIKSTAQRTGRAGVRRSPRRTLRSTGTRTRA